MNLGKFDYIGGTYTKIVKFRYAVLWKDRQISLPLPIMSMIKERGITKIVFIDYGKNEKWVFDVEQVNKMGERKMVGQEPQWYFPIEMATKKPAKEMFEYK